MLSDNVIHIANAGDKLSQYSTSSIYEIVITFCYFEEVESLILPGNCEFFLIMLVYLGFRKLLSPEINIDIH